MNTITHLWADHSTAITLLGAYIFLGIVSVLPKPGDPRPVSEKAYDSFYSLLHLLANRIAEKYKQDPQQAQPTAPK